VDIYLPIVIVLSTEEAYKKKMPQIRPPFHIHTHTHPPLLSTPTLSNLNLSYKVYLSPTSLKAQDSRLSKTVTFNPSISHIGIDLELQGMVHQNKAKER
jgi:hypothetical protein